VTGFDSLLALARQVFPFVENHNFYVEHWHHSIFFNKARELGAVLVLGELLIQRRLQHRLGQLLQQPVRAGQGQALLPGQPHELRRGRLPSGRFRPLASCHVVQCRGHHGTSPARPSGLA
jgi:hypothetical protein